MGTLAQAAAAVSQGAQRSWLEAYAVQAAGRVAKRYGLDQARLQQAYVRLIAQESGWDPEAYNASSNASGIAQIVPQWHPNVDPWDATAALDYGADYLGSMISRYGGDFLRGTAAYNFGPGNVDRLAGLDNSNFVMNLPGETQTYVKNILGIQPPNTGGGMPPPIPREGPEGDPIDQLIEDWLKRQSGGGDANTAQPGTLVQKPDGTWEMIGGGYIERKREADLMDQRRSGEIDFQQRMALEAFLNQMGPTPYQQAQLGVDYARLGQSREEMQQQMLNDALNRQLQAIEEARMQQTLAETTRQNQRDTLIAAGPSMTAGQGWFGGFSPGGPAGAIANFAGVVSPPRSTAQSQVPLDVNAGPAQANPQLMQLLNRYLNGG